MSQQRCVLVGIPGLLHCILACAARARVRYSCRWQGAMKVRAASHCQDVQGASCVLTPHLMRHACRRASCNGALLRIRPHIHLLGLMPPTALRACRWRRCTPVLAQLAASTSVSSMRSCCKEAGR